MGKFIDSFKSALEIGAEMYEKVENASDIKRLKDTKYAKESLRWGKNKKEVELVTGFFSLEGKERKASIEYLKHKNSLGAGILKKLNSRYNRITNGAKFGSIVTAPFRATSRLIALATAPSTLTTLTAVAISDDASYADDFMTCVVGSTAAYGVGLFSTPLFAVSSAAIIATASPSILNAQIANKQKERLMEDSVEVFENLDSLLGEGVLEGVIDNPPQSIDAARIQAAAEAKNEMA